jgi:putative transcriptional regulator
VDSLQNHFLIAMPRLGDPNFGESVTYICQHDAAGALGIVINKPSGVTLAEICSRMDIDVSPGADASLPVLSGGPVEPARGFVLHDASQEYEGTVPIDEDIRLTVSRDALEALARGDGPKRVLFALGYAGWGQGQLEAELAANSWLSVRASTKILFETPFQDRWVAAAELIGIDIHGISDYSGRA